MAPITADGSDPRGEENTEQVASRVDEMITGALTTHLMHIGDKLGLYQNLKTLKRCTPDQLAKATNLHPRWVQEWLYQQAAAKLISTDSKAEEFWMSAAQTNVLANEHGPDASPLFRGGLPGAVSSMFRVSDQLCEAFRTGQGLTYDAYGEDLALGTCRELGVWVRHSMVTAIREQQDICEMLERGVKVADIGCGCGQALRTLAEEFPNSTFHGYDISKEALAKARAFVAAKGLTNVTLYDAGTDEEALPKEECYEFMYTLDAIHDMAHPVPVLRAVHAALSSSGMYMIGDFKCFNSPADNVLKHPFGAMLFGFSVNVCLSSSMSCPQSSGLGTAGFPEAVARQMTTEAGFDEAKFEQRDLGHEMQNFYFVRK